MDTTDRKILNIIQTGFPVESRPFQALGEMVGIDEDEAIERVKALKEDDIIRRTGATFDSKKLGFVSTLCAAEVPEEKIDEFVQAVNTYPGVTHNYERNHRHNIWFTFIAESREEIERCLEEISQKTGILGIKNLPARRFFKIRVNFNMKE